MEFRHPSVDLLTSNLYKPELIETLSLESYNVNLHSHPLN